MNAVATIAVFARLHNPYVRELRTILDKLRSLAVLSFEMFVFLADVEGERNHIKQLLSCKLTVLPKIEK